MMLLANKPILNNEEEAYQNIPIDDVDAQKRWLDSRNVK